MMEPRTGHISPVERIIRAGGGMPTYGADATQERNVRDYIPYTIDAMPRMGFTIYHYSRDGELVRHDVMFHEMRNRVVKSHGYYVLYSFNADGVVFQLRGGQNMYELADAIVDCKLHTAYVYDPKVWPQPGNEIEPIDRIAVRSVRSDDMHGYEPLEGDGT